MRPTEYCTSGSNGNPITIRIREECHKGSKEHQRLKAIETSGLVRFCAFVSCRRVRLPGSPYFPYSRATRTALLPPKPKEFDIAVRRGARPSTTLAPSIT